MPKQKQSAYQVLRRENTQLQLQVDTLSQALPLKMLDLNAAIKEKQELENKVMHLRDQLDAQNEHLRISKEIYEDVIALMLDKMP